MPYRGGPLLSYPQKCLTIPTDGSLSSLLPCPEHDDNNSNTCWLMQVLTHADTCHYMSLIDQHQKIHAMEIQLQVAHMIHQGV